MNKSPVVTNSYQGSAGEAITFNAATPRMTNQQEHAEAVNVPAAVPVTKNKEAPVQSLSEEMSSLPPLPSPKSLRVASEDTECIDKIRAQLLQLVDPATVTDTYVLEAPEPLQFASSGGTATSSTQAFIPYRDTYLRSEIVQISFDEGVFIGTVDSEEGMAGYGVAVWTTGDRYCGEWLDDRMDGYGAYTWADGDYYRGSYEDGYMSGYGEMQDGTGVYLGDWVDDMRQGQGRMVYAGGNIYDGEWLAGMRHGHGKLLEPSVGVCYEGEFIRNEKEGKGVQTNANGDVYDGEFSGGKPNGRGKYYWADGATYIGTFKNGLKHGEGCEYLANGDWIAGTFVNGEHEEGQSFLHKAIGIDFDDEELPDELSAALQPLDAEKLQRLAAAAEALARGKTISIMEDEEQQQQAATPASHPAADTTTTSAPAVTGAVETAGGAQASTAKAAVEAGADTSDQNDTSAAAAATTVTVPGTSTSAADGPDSSFAKALARHTLIAEQDLVGWSQMKIIGKGSFGAVYEALLHNGRTVCCKVVELGAIAEPDELDKLKNEIALMRRLHHPNIVQYYGSLEDDANKSINIFMEMVTGGSLNSFVKKFKSIPTVTMQQWTYQMVCGVKYLHECGIVHRDIKGDNVLVSMDGIVKLADFGCSKAIDDVCSATHGCSTMVGTPYWMAPEVIKCEAGGYGMKSDIWSIGCTIVEMITGKPPWPECNSMWAAVYKIANSTGLPTEIPKDLDPQLMDLLQKCFERDPKKRPTAAQMLEHPFLKGVVSDAL